LGAPSPSSWSELILVLAECVVKPSWVGDAPLGPDEFDRLSAFSDIDSLCFILAIVLGKCIPDDFF
jgi:hypothetical protein